MVDITKYLAILTDPEKLLIALPIAIVSITVIILLVTYIRSSLKKKAAAIKGSEKKKKLERVDYHGEFNNIVKIKDPNAAIMKLFLLINKFLSQLFKLDRAFTYEEIKREVKTYGFIEIVELCNTLSNLGFGKNNYSKSDFQELSGEFEKVLNSYEYIIDEEFKTGEKKNVLGFKLPSRIGELKSILIRLKEIPSYLTMRLTPHKVSFKSVWVELTPLIKQTQVKQLEKYLLLRHPHLFNKETKERSKLVNVKDKKGEILRLIKLGKAEIKRGNTLSTSAIYNSIVLLFNSFTPKEREPFGDQVNELYINVLNLIGLKASYELIDKIGKAIASNDYDNARQIFYQLKYIYSLISPETSAQVQKKWLEYNQKFGKY